MWKAKGAYERLSRFGICGEYLPIALLARVRSFFSGNASAMTLEYFDIVGGARVLSGG